MTPKAAFTEDGESSNRRKVMTTNKTIGIGIIGVGGWATYGHLPAVQTLDNVDLVAVSSRSKDRAEALAAEHGIAHAFDDHKALIAHPDVDLVVIPAPAPHHYALVKDVIEGGKDVYSEWPLTTNTAESEELLALAEAKGVRHVVGLQRRFAPSSRYFHDLIAEGHIGNIRGVHMAVGVDAFPAWMPQDHAWILDPANFVNLLPVYAGHFGDLLFNAVGNPRTLTAITANEFPTATVIETGEEVPNPVPTQARIMGELDGGALYSMQFEGGQEHKTGLQIVVTGTEGSIRVSNVRAFENEDDNTIEAMTGDAEAFSVLPVPDRYTTLPDNDLDVSVQDVAYHYDAYAADVREGTRNAADFADAVRLHRMLDRITETAAAASSEGDAL